MPTEPINSCRSDAYAARRILSRVLGYLESLEDEQLTKICLKGGIIRNLLEIREIQPKALLLKSEEKSDNCPLLLVQGEPLTDS